MTWRLLCGAVPAERGTFAIERSIPDMFQVAYAEVLGLGGFSVVLKATLAGGESTTTVVSFKLI